MATVTVFDQDKNQVGERELAEGVFNTEVKEYLLHDMVRYQRASKTGVRSPVVARNLTVRRGPVMPVRVPLALLTLLVVVLLSVRSRVPMLSS